MIAAIHLNSLKTKKINIQKNQHVWLRSRAFDFGNPFLRLNLMSRHKVIKTEFAPAAIGPYSQAVCAGNMVFVSGQLGINPKTGQLVEGGIEPQTRQALENVKSILYMEALAMKDVVQVQVFLADIKDFAAMNEIYAEYFAEPYPSRAAFQVAALPKDGLVEIMAVAVL